MYPGKVERVTAVIVRNEHYTGKDNHACHGLSPAAEAIKDCQNKNYQERACSKNEIVLDKIVFGGYLGPAHNSIETKRCELVQGGGAWDREDKKQPDKSFLVTGGRFNKVECSGELPDVKADDAD